jgi:diacylglycerol kinase family enzyme
VVQALRYWYVQSAVVPLSELKVGAIINTSSGGCDLESEAKVLTILEQAGIVEPKTWCGAATEMQRSFREAAEQKLEVLIALGGDGTIWSAAEACAETGRFLIPLPGGTMNMLSRALYGDMSWEDALKNTLAAPTTRVLSGGRVADKRFFVAATIGAPSLWAEARESIREGEMADAIEKGGIAFQNMFEGKVQYLISEKIKGEAEAVILICPLISEQMADSEQALEAAVIDVVSAGEVVRLATTAVFGKWRDNRNILLTKTKRVSVRSSKDIPAILDGERVNLGRSAEIGFVSKAVKVIVAANKRLPSPEFPFDSSTH